MGFLKRFIAYLALLVVFFLLMGVVFVTPAFIGRQFGEGWGFITAAIEITIFLAASLAASEI